MSYEYSDKRREEEVHALPNVEIFLHERPYAGNDQGDCWYSAGIWNDSDDKESAPTGYYFAFGSPGCLWDGEPSGPYATYDLALAASRE